MDSISSSAKRTSCRSAWRRPYFSKIFATHAVRKTEIVFHDRLPLRHGVAGIDHQRVALRPPQINRRGKPGDASADDDHLTHLRIIEVFVLNHNGYTVDLSSLRKGSALPYLNTEERSQPRL